LSKSEVSYRWKDEEDKGGARNKDTDLIREVKRGEESTVICWFLGWKSIMSKCTLNGIFEEVNCGAVQHEPTNMLQSGEIEAGDSLFLEICVEFHFCDSVV
jgi:hypothetical protein